MAWRPRGRQADGQAADGGMYLTYLPALRTKRTKSTMRQDALAALAAGGRGRVLMRAPAGVRAMFMGITAKA